jgi:hypothetical protein
MRGNSWPTENLLASQEWLRSMKEVLWWTLLRDVVGRNSLYRNRGTTCTLLVNRLTTQQQNLWNFTLYNTAHTNKQCTISETETKQFYLLTRKHVYKWHWVVMKHGCQLTCNTKKTKLQVKGGQYYTDIILSDQHLFPFPIAVPTAPVEIQNKELRRSETSPCNSCAKSILQGWNLRCCIIRYKLHMRFK